jgi:hypothetical protein
MRVFLSAPADSRAACDARIDLEMTGLVRALRGVAGERARRDASGANRCVDTR